MSDEENNQNNELLAILGGNVGEVTAAMEGLSDDDLNTLLTAEESGKTRKGVVDAISKLLAHAQPTRADEIASEIEALEAGAIDIRAAAQLNALRTELNEIEGTDA